MIVTRALSVFLRFAQFVCAAIVLGLVAYFLDKRNDNQWDGLLGRLVYTIVIAALSVLFSLVWLIPTASSMMHYPFDLLMCAAWFAVFGVLVVWLGDRETCGAVFSWGTIRFRNSYCGQWKATEAFSFLSAIFWFVSFLLGVYVYHKVSRRPVATDGAYRRRRWHRSRV
ncbi:integral membrane protein [Dendryphion nanum]|uniref:Integral membrane protein n=1 Tax=Dendryphion nanum TaxID=256645 RepID=A0A9P9DXL4_9PLEO|nr:integral membrane protein [Dendryphion nanum]